MSKTNSLDFSLIVFEFGKKHISLSRRDDLLVH